MLFRSVVGRSAAVLLADVGAYGPDGVRFYTRRKTITQRWPASDVQEKAVFNFPSNQ